MSNEVILKRLDAIENKLDLIIANTTKRTRSAPKIDEETELQIDEVMEMWKLRFNKPNVNIKSQCHRRPIKARIKEGYKFDDFVKVIDNKINDPHFVKNPQYFNPATLFGGKFDVYLNSGKIEEVVNVQQQKAERDNDFFNDFNEGLGLGG